METKDNGKNPILLYGTFGAVITWLCGFGVMYLLWRKIGTINGLPGFFDYHAATYGDGLCLPILVGTGIAFLKNNKRDYELVDIRKCRWIAILMALIGGLIQASWLISARTALNWSIPIQYHFNIAGWYHSIFFIGMFGVIAYLLAGIWCTIRKKTSDYTWLDKDLLLIFVTAGTLFILLFASDDYPQYIENGIAYPVICLGIMFTLEIACRIANNEAVAEIMFANSIGVIGGLGVFLLIIFEERGDIALTIAGVLCTCFLWRADKHAYKQIIFMSMYMFVVFWGIFNILSTGISVEKAVLILITLYIPLYKYQKYCLNIKVLDIGLVLISGYVWVSERIMEHPDYDLLSLAFIWAVFLFFQKEIKEVFNVVIESEQKKNNGEIDDKQFAIIKGGVYTQIVVGIVVVVIILYKWLMEIATVYGKLFEGGLQIDKSCILSIAIIVGSALTILFINRRNAYKKVCRTAIFSVVICGYALIMLNMWKYFIQATKEPLHVYFIIMLCLIFFANAGGAAILRHGYEMNLVTLRGLKRKKNIVCMSYIIGINCFIISYITSFVILTNRTWTSTLVCTIDMLVATCGLPVLSAEVLKMEYKKTIVVPNKPVGGVAQDGLMVFILVLFVAYLPCLYCGSIEWENTFNNLNSTLICLGGLTTLIGTALEPIGFCLQNNIQHLEQQYKVAKKQNQMETWEQLHKHLNIQSKQTVFATLPYVIVVLISKYLAMNNTKKGHWKEYFIEKYIDKKSYD